MNPKAQRIAIAEACGWTFVTDFTGTPPGVKSRLNTPLPDYLSDLNAMHEAESMLETNGKHSEYLSHIKATILREAGLRTDGHCGDWRVFRATAAQRAEAFLKTLNLWKP